ncbi:MAG: carotenoid oxygenase family protein [Deltaproteobacteria bacterium]|jgi:carotenoid cleavage dioxygenase-like enzyme|nr:carotenoid oxygenase family protein [Deltaproteobacteria bacterium]
MYEHNNPFLIGNFAPWREEGDETDLLVEGEIPPDLNGSLYRIGPNPYFPPRGRYHWFDGDGMVHAITIRERRASYRNRYVKTEGLAEEMKAGKALYGGLINPSSEAKGPMPFKNAANTNIIGYANRLLALYEAGLPHELQPVTLETIGTFNFCGRLNGPMTAHPKIDPGTGELLFFGYQPFPPFVTYHRASAVGELIESRPIDTGLPVMMHDFVVTRDHVVFFVCPSVFRIENLSKGLPMIAWEPQHGTRIGVMKRGGGEICWFDSEACFIFHFLNGYEDGNRVIIDACRSTSIDMSGNNFGPNPPVPHRFTIDLSSGDVNLEQTDERSAEFPRINERFAGLRHRYGYFASGPVFQNGKNFFRNTIKLDYQTARSEVQELGAGMFPTEPVFAQRPGRSGETDGYILTVWYDEAKNTSEVTIQDAANFSAMPQARVKLSHRIPFGFHGNWVQENL